MTQSELNYAVRGKLVAEHIADFSEAELQRCLGSVVLPEKCLRSAREQIASGLTIHSLYTEFPVWAL